MATAPIEAYLERYRTRYPAGSEGDREITGTLRTAVLSLTDLDAAELTGEELATITEAARSRMTTLYTTYAGMTRDELIIAGVQMYVLDFVLPFLRLAGLGDDDTIGALGLRRLGALTEAAYPKLADQATAAALLPRVLIMGEGFVPTSGDDPLAAP